jgi:hypothetical protein
VRPQRFERTLVLANPLTNPEDASILMPPMYEQRGVAAPGTRRPHYAIVQLPSNSQGSSSPCASVRSAVILGHQLTVSWRSQDMRQGRRMSAVMQDVRDNRIADKGGFG